MDPGSSADGTVPATGGMRSASPAARTVAAISALTDELTPGQRWTTALAGGLAVLILAFGLPSPVRTVIEAAPVGPASRVGEVEGDDPGIGPTGPAPGLVAGGSGPGVGSDGTPVISDGPQPSADGAPDTPAAGPLRVVALADPSLAVPGRGDDAIALHFVLEVGLPAAVELLDDAGRVCAVASRAAVAVASAALPPEVDACLAEAGVVVISWDDAKPAGKAAPALSTRRGAATSLIDTARTLDLDGRSALVADGRLRHSLEPAIDLAAGEGLTFVDTVWLDGSASPSVALALASMDLDHVVFATSTANQSTIATQLRPFAPAVDHVVLDVADSVVEGRTSPALDGARAVTSVQFPWHPGNEGFRSSCRSSWEEAQPSLGVVGDAELLRVLQWCQHVRLAAAVAELLAAGAEPAEAKGQSGLTTAIGPLPGGGFGPTRLTTATWSASCACWSADGSFEELR